MKLYIILLVAVLVQSFSSQALTKAEALMQSKSRIEGLKNQFASLAYNCFMFETDCQIYENSQVITLKWFSYELAEFEPMIEYNSGSDNFLIDGAVRIAKTGHSWGAKVVFNEDLLVVQLGDNHFRGLNFYEILGILIHEFGHHQEEMLTRSGLPILTHEQLDEVAVKTVSYLQDRTKKIHIGSDEVPGLNEDNSLDVLLIDIEWNNGIRNIYSKLYIDSRYKTYEISSSIVSRLKCPLLYDDGRITFKGVPEYFSMRKLHLPLITYKDATLTYEQFFDDASVFCVDYKFNTYQVFSGYTDGKLTLIFSRNNNGLLEYNSGSIQATTPP